MKKICCFCSLHLRRSDYSRCCKKQSRRTHRHSEGKTAAGGPGYFDTCKQESTFGFHQCQQKRYSGCQLWQGHSLPVGTHSFYHSYLGCR